jgi:hypothetical protein
MLRHAHQTFIVTVDVAELGHLTQLYRRKLSLGRENLTWATAEAGLRLVMLVRTRSELLLKALVFLTKCFDKYIGLGEFKLCAKQQFLGIFVFPLLLHQLHREIVRALVQRFDFVEHAAAFKFAFATTNSGALPILDKAILVLRQRFPHLDQLLLTHHLNVDLEVTALDFVTLFCIVSLSIAHGPLILIWGILNTGW